MVGSVTRGCRGVSESGGVAEGARMSPVSKSVHLCELLCVGVNACIGVGSGGCPCVCRCLVGVGMYMSVDLRSGSDSRASPSHAPLLTTSIY